MEQHRLTWLAQRRHIQSKRPQHTQQHQKLLQRTHSSLSQENINLKQNRLLRLVPHLQVPLQRSHIRRELTNTQSHQREVLTISKISQRDLQTTRIKEGSIQKKTLIASSEGLLLKARIKTKP